MLAHCLAEAGIHAIAVQEACTETGVLRTSGYLRFSSGHEAGCLGAELWFREGHALIPASAEGGPRGFHGYPLRPCFAVSSSLGGADPGSPPQGKASACVSVVK